MKRSKHITLDDLPPKYRQQAAAQLMSEQVERTAQGIVEHMLEPEEKPDRKDRKPKGPDKTEQLFNREMLGDLGMYEAITLRLPGGSKYTGDWVTSVFDPQTQQYETTVYEVKCPYRHASHGRALTAFREARAAFPFLTFKWFERQKGGGEKDGGKGARGGYHGEKSFRWHPVCLLFGGISR